MSTYALIIDGKRVETEAHFEVRNPATGEVVGLAPKATLEQLEAAIASAKAAFPAWSQRPEAERQALCHAPNSPSTPTSWLAC